MAMSKYMSDSGPVFLLSLLFAITTMVVVRADDDCMGEDGSICGCIPEVDLPTFDIIDPRAACGTAADLTRNTQRALCTTTESG
jgi:hypothetical protein